MSKNLVHLGKKNSENEREKERKKESERDLVVDPNRRASRWSSGFSAGERLKVNGRPGTSRSFQGEPPALLVLVPLFHRNGRRYQPNLT